MKTKEAECRNCGVSTWMSLGFVPAVVFEETEHNNWVRAELCLSCGATKTIAPTPEDIDRAIDGYLEILQEYDLITEEEARLIER